MVSKRTATWIILALMLSLPVTCFRVSAVDSIDYIPNEVVVRFKEKISPKHIKLIEDQGGIAIDSIDARGLLLVRIPEDRTPAFINALQRSPLVEYAERNHIDKPTFAPNDPMWNLQWNMPLIHADRAWDIENGSKGILVAVVDSGIDYNHEDLASNYQLGGYDWDSNDADPYPDAGYAAKDHGTHCAGIIAAVLNNGIGVTGLAQVRLLAQKIFGTGAKTGTHWAMAQAFYNSTDLGAKIISYSASGGNSTTKYDAVKYAYEHDVLIVAAAGNEGTNDPTNCYPAAYNEVVSVAATTINDQRASYSNWGDWIEISAPGGDAGNQIYSTFVDGYGYMYGTSMACPHVSGVAALIWSQFPGYTRDQVRDLLRSSADDLGDPGRDPYYGFGRVNAYRALNRPPTAPEVTSPNSGEIWKGTHDITWTASTDPDTDNPPTYQIQYSSNDGGAWNPLANGIAETHYSWDTTTCPDSSSYLVKVRAYDGDLYSQWDQSDSVFTVDNNPPTTTIEHTPGSSTISLSASDTASGVEATNYRIDGGDWTLYTEPIPLTETSHTMDCFSVDAVGNIESPPKSLTVHSLAINVSPPESGLTSPAPGTYLYDSGSSVTVSGTPASGYTVDYWDLDGSDVGKDTSYNVTMDAPHTLIAIFKIVIYDATIKAYCNAEGKEVVISFTWDGDSHTTPQTFKDQTLGHTVAVAENDDSGHPFVKWTKDGVNYSTEKTITISSGGTYTAIYADTTPPETSITSGPSETINYNDVTYSWTGSDDVTPTISLVYSYYLVGHDGDWSAWTADTSKQYNDLPDGNYTFNVKAKDKAGNEDPTPAERSFKVDTTPPTVVDHSPTSTDVAVTTKITVTFSEAMDKVPAENAFSVSPSVSGLFSWSDNTTVFTPGANLAYNTTYSVTIGTGAMDLAGNHLQSPYSWQFKTVSNAINVTSPNGGQSWVRGTTHNITWTSTGSPGAYVKIELLKSGTVNRVITSSTANDGSYSWTIPSNQTLGTDYKIRITSTSSSAVTDSSNSKFAIVAGTLTVTSPNGGESWKRGTVHTITWSKSGSPGSYVKIELLKSGVVNRVITSSTADDGYYSWTIPSTQTTGTDYKIRITSTRYPSITDSSNSKFAITSRAGAKESQAVLLIGVKGTVAKRTLSGGSLNCRACGLKTCGHFTTASKKKGRFHGSELHLSGSRPRDCTRVRRQNGEHPQYRQQNYVHSRRSSERLGTPRR